MNLMNMDFVREEGIRCRGPTVTAMSICPSGAWGLRDQAGAEGPPFLP